MTIHAQRIGTIILSMILLAFAGMDAGAQDCPQYAPITTDSASDLQVVDGVSLEAPGVWQLGWSADGQLLYVVTADSTIHLYSAADWSAPPETWWNMNLNTLWILEGNRMVIAAPALDEPPPFELVDSVEFVSPRVDALAPDGTFGVIGLRDVVRIVDFPSGDVIAAYPTRPEPECDNCDGGNYVALSPDATRVVYSSSRDSIPPALIDLETGSVTHDVYVAYRAPVFSPDGTLIASAVGSTREGTGDILLADGYTGGPVATIHTGSEVDTNAAFSPDGGLLVSGATDVNHPDQWLIGWDVDDLVGAGEGDNDSALFWLSGVGTGRGLSQIAFNPDGTLLATARLFKKTPAGGLDGDGTAVLIWGILAPCGSE